MANITGASLTPILERLNAVQNYHPFDANTFTDWSLESGDTISISRGEDTYASPIHNQKIVWRGIPETTLSSVGQEERDSISNIGKRKYGRGTGGMRSQQGFQYALYDENGYLRSVMDYSESHLRTEFQDADNSIRSVVEQTASYWRATLEDSVNSLHSEVEQTASYWRASLDDAKNDLHSEVEQTASYWRSTLEDTANSLHSEVQQTASYWRSTLEDTANSLHSEVQQTASYWRSSLEDTANSLHSEIEQTASYWRSTLEDVSNSLHSEVEQTASSWSAKISGVADENGNVTAASMAVAINEAGEGVATIDANKVYIGNAKSTTVIAGKASLSDVTADSIASKLATLSNLAVTKVTTEEIDAGTLKFRPVYGMGSVDVATGYNGSNLTLSGNTYTLRLAKFNGQYDEWTFSRATSLSAAWDGNRKFTVGATPQGNERYTQIVSAVPTLKATIDDGEYTVDVGDVTVNGDEPYLLGYSDGAASGGTTILGASWSGSKIIVTASPQGVTLERLLQAGATTWSGTTATVPISSVYGSSGQYSDGVVFSPTVDVSSKLQTKSVTANGTYTPGSGYVGFSSVTVNVPATSAKARFNASSGQYYIEAIDTTTMIPLPNSSESYSLELSTSSGNHSSSTVVQINHSGSGSTPTLALSGYWSEARTAGYNSAKVSGSWGTGNNSNVWTVSKGSSGSNNLSMTVTAGVSAQSYNSSTHKYTAFGYAYGDGVQKASSGGSVSGTEAYDAGKTDGNTAAGVSGSWSGKVYTVTRSANTATKSLTCTVTAGASISYNSSTHTYTATGRAYGNATERENKTATSGTEAFEAGKLAASHSITNFALTSNAGETAGGYTNNSNGWYEISGSGTSKQVGIVVKADWKCDGNSKVARGNLSGAATNIYRTAYTAGQNAVSINAPTWSTTPASGVSVSSNTATFKTNAPTQSSRNLAIHISQDSSFDSTTHKKYVYAHHTNTNSGNRIARLQVDATTVYTDGKSAGKTELWGSVGVSYGSTSNDCSGYYADAVAKLIFNLSVTGTGMTAKAMPQNYYQTEATNIYKKGFKAGWQAALSTARSYWWYGTETIDGVNYWTVWTPTASAYSTCSASHSPVYTEGARWEAAKYRIPTSYPNSYTLVCSSKTQTYPGSTIYNFTFTLGGSSASFAVGTSYTFHR